MDFTEKLALSQTAKIDRLEKQNHAQADSIQHYAQSDSLRTTKLNVIFPVKE